MLSTKHKIAIARFLNMAIVGARSLAGRPSSVTVRRRNVNWKLNLNEGIDFALYLGLYQRLPHRVTRWVTPGALVLDVGANIGAHSLLLARAAGGSGHVVAIEPTDYGFSCLRANAELNPDLLARLIPVQAALTSGAKRQDSMNVTRFHSRWPLRSGDIERHATHMGVLETANGARFLTLDDMLTEIRAKYKIDRPVAFIKLDVDGHELDVLQGATQTLGLQPPPILIEIAPHVQDEVPQRFEALLRLLESYGYQLEEAESGKRLPMSAPALRALIVDGASIDAIARAEQKTL